jgi:PKD repeat protein
MFDLSWKTKKSLPKPDAGLLQTQSNTKTKIMCLLVGCVIAMLMVPFSVSAKYNSEGDVICGSEGDFWGCWGCRHRYNLHYSFVEASTGAGTCSVNQDGNVVCDFSGSNYDRKKYNLGSYVCTKHQYEDGYYYDDGYHNGGYIRCENPSSYYSRNKNLSGQVCAVNHDGNIFCGTAGDFTGCFGCRNWYNPRNYFTDVSVGANYVCAVTGTRNDAPTASFTATPENPETDQQVSFDGTDTDDPDGSIDNYSWNFGSGEGATSGSVKSQVTHEYSSAGTYTVDLTVTDDGGATNSTSTDVAVTESVEATTTGSIKVKVVDQNGNVIQESADVTPSIDGSALFTFTGSDINDLSWSISVGETPQTAELTQSDIDLPAGYDFADSNWISKFTENNYNNNPVSGGTGKATTAKLKITPNQ